MSSPKKIYTDFLDAIPHPFTHLAQRTVTAGHRCTLTVLLLVFTNAGGLDFQIPCSWL
ncbi:hypothetical protein EMIT0P100_150002 [Pseudomonas sp. IT-P100]